MPYSEENLLCDLHALSLLLGGVEIKFFSADGISRFLNHQNKDMPFCAMMFASPYGYRECAQCDRKNLQYAQKTGECIQYRCHMMLTEIIQPVFVKGRYVGSLFYGQFHEKELLPQQKWEAIFGRLKNWGIPMELAKENYFRLPVFDREQISSIRALLQTFARLCEDQQLFVLSQDSRFYEIEQYVEEHLHQNITLQEIAGRLHMNPSYLSSYFQKTYQLPLFSYIREKRIQKACGLLQTTNLPIRQIAEMVGFSDQNYFTKVFQRQMKITPRNYRKSLMLR